MKTVITFGTFDVIHPGHKSYLAQARELGDRLVVVVARDATAEKMKGRWPKNDERARLQKIIESNLADEAVLGDLEDKYKVLEKFRPDVVALGYDQKTNMKKLEEKLRKFNIEPKIVRLSAYKPEIYKSSKL
jgi:FAD synthetase